VKLVLFDIDGTLLRAGPQVGRILLAAMDEIFGVGIAEAVRASAAGYDFAGRTDSRITLDLLAAGGIEESLARPRLHELRQRYGERLAAELDPSKMRLLPGVRELLCRCLARDDLALGLLTGNWEVGARAKLAPFGLNDCFPFGAFGDDGTERWELPPKALARAHQHLGHAIADQDVVIIGDTLHDVECGRVHGLDVLAVATGHSTSEQLRSAGARWVVDDLVALDDESWNAVVPSREGSPTPSRSSPALD
jgi:phosphoglycolate phosphatase-like HAD superfamily hydrolase